MFYYPKEKLLYAVGYMYDSTKSFPVSAYFDVNSFSLISPKGNFLYEIDTVFIEYVENIPILLRLELINSLFPPKLFLYVYFQDATSISARKVGNIDLYFDSHISVDATASTFAQLYFLYIKNFFNCKEHYNILDFDSYNLNTKRINGSVIRVINPLLVKLMITHLELKEQTKHELPNNYG